MNSNKTGAAGGSAGKAGAAPNKALAKAGDAPVPGDILTGRRVLMRDLRANEDMRFSRLDLMLPGLAVGSGRVVGVGKDVSHLVHTALDASGPLGLNLLAPQGRAAQELRSKFSQFLYGQWAFFRLDRERRPDLAVGQPAFARGSLDMALSTMVPDRKDPLERYEIDAQPVLRMRAQEGKLLMAILCRFPDKDLPLKAKLPGDDLKSAFSLMTALFDLSQLPFLTQRYKIDPKDSELVALIEAQTELIARVRGLATDLGAAMSPKLDALPFLTSEALAKDGG